MRAQAAWILGKGPGALTPGKVSRVKLGEGLEERLQGMLCDCGQNGPVPCPVPEWGDSVQVV